MNAPKPSLDNVNEKLIQPQQLPSTPIYYVTSPTEYPEDEINLLDYWRVLVRYKWMIFLLTTLVTGGAVLAALLAPPVFRAEVILSPVAEEKSGGLSAIAGQLGGLASLAGVSMGGGGGRIEEALATLKSRIFTDAFIKEHQLSGLLLDGPPIQVDERWPWVAEWQEKWKAYQQQDAGNTKPPTAWDIFKTFNSIRQVTQDKTSGLVTVAIEWGEPQLAASWANELVARLNKHQKQGAIEEAERSIEYLKDQAEQTSVVEMRQSIYRLIEAQTKNIMLANVREEFAFKVIDPALAPEEPTKPKRKLMIILGFMVGLMLSVFLAFFLSFIKNQKAQDKPAVTPAHSIASESEG